MDQEPKLRSVPPTGSGTGPRPGALGRSESPPPQGRVPLVLATALAVALVLLVWSYLAMGSRIDTLESEAALLRAAVAERDELINAQRARLDEVRGRVQELLVLVEQPVAGAPPLASEPTPEPP
jgi:hypothetical protein